MSVDGPPRRASLVYRHDADATGLVALLEDAGFDPIDLGDLATGRRDAADPPRARRSRPDPALSRSSDGQQPVRESADNNPRHQGG